MKHTHEPTPPLFKSHQPDKGVPADESPLIQFIQENVDRVAKDMKARSLRACNIIPPADPNVQPPDVRRLAGQNAELLAWLQAGERVTPRTAYERYVTRLAARVFDLRAAGYAVKSDYDAGSKCSVYWMEVGR